MYLLAVGRMKAHNSNLDAPYTSVLGLGENVAIAKLISMISKCLNMKLLSEGYRYPNYNLLLLYELYTIIKIKVQKYCSRSSNKSFSTISIDIPINTVLFIIMSIKQARAGEK